MITCMDPTYILDITSLVGLLQEIAEIAHQLLILDLFPYPFLHRVAGHIHQHQQHTQSGPSCRWFFFSTNANTNAIFTISGS